MNTDWNDYISSHLRNLRITTPAPAATHRRPAAVDDVIAVEHRRGEAGVIRDDADARADRRARSRVASLPCSCESAMRRIGSGRRSTSQTRP